MKIHWGTTLLIGLMIVGCDSLKKDDPMTISKIQISSDPANKADVRQIVVTNQHSLIGLNLFLANHSSGWETPQTTPPSPDDFVVIYKISGESFNLGYASNMLFKYKWGHDKCKRIDHVQIETFKKLVNTIRRNSEEAAFE